MSTYADTDVTPTPTVRPDGHPPFARFANGVVSVARRLGAIQLTPSAIQAAADRSSGLVDEHPEEVEEPLALLCEDFAEHPPTDLGAAMIHTSLVQALANRRRIQDAYRRVRPDPVRAPVVIVGRHRTGTTLLHDVLDAVPELGYIPLYRLMDPIPRYGSLARAVAATRVAWAIAPEMPVLHPQSVRGPEECWLLVMSSLRVEGFTQHWLVPRYTKWMETCDQAPAYRLWARVLALIQAERGGGTFVLKDAAHLKALPELIDAIPDARLIWTHRKPMDCVGSFSSLSAIQHRSMYGVYDAERAGRVSLERLATALRRGLADRERVPAGQLIDVAYPDLVREPVQTVSDICEQLDIPLPPEGREAVAAYLVKKRERRPPRHRWDLAQWGLEDVDWEEEFSFYDPAFWGGDRG